MATVLARPHRVPPVALALYAAGGFVMLSGLVFLSPFAFSPFAQQNDVYMGNLFLGLPTFGLGSLVFAASLVVLGLSRRLAALLVLLILLIVVMPLLIVFALPIPLYPYLAGTGAVLLVVVSWVTARKHNQLASWGRGLLLAVAGGGVLALLYILFGGQYVSMGNTPVNWPPYLTIPLLCVAAGQALAIFLIGWIWGDLPSRQEPASETASQT